MTDLDALARRQQRVGWSILLFVGVALTVGMCASARAADRQFEIWAVRASKALQDDKPNWIKVSVDPFPTRTDCMNALPEISIDKTLRTTGWRLTCRQTDR